MLLSSEVQFVVTVAFNQVAPMFFLLCLCYILTRGNVKETQSHSFDSLMLYVLFVLDYTYRGIEKYSQKDCSPVIEYSDPGRLIL